jgi:hypothetical protein
MDEDLRLKIKDLILFLTPEHRYWLHGGRILDYVKSFPVLKEENLFNLIVWHDDKIKFVNRLIHVLHRYGKDKDGNYALITFLEQGKLYVKEDRKRLFDEAITELNAFYRDREASFAQSSLLSKIFSRIYDRLTWPSPGLFERDTQFPMRRRISRILYFVLFIFIIYYMMISVNSIYKTPHSFTPDPNVTTIVNNLTPTDFLTNTPQPPVLWTQGTVVFRSLAGQELGRGTIRLYVSDNVYRGETLLVQLELQVAEYAVTPTISPARTFVPATNFPNSPSFMTSTPLVTSTPRNPKEAKSNIDVYELMGASLFCSDISFSGCDSTSKSLQPKNIHLVEPTKWSWILSPAKDAVGKQNLQISLWSAYLDQNNTTLPQDEWDYTFEIIVINPEAQPFVELLEKLAPIIVALVTLIAPFIAGIYYVYSKRSKKDEAKSATEHVASQAQPTAEQTVSQTPPAPSQPAPATNTPKKPKPSKKL